ncbi:hypothetical protein VKI22_05660 [Cyanobacterium aponinum UTEX 3221]|uniref:hypothetical protein n=1 Tax=Cyanobacterium aponinum TaxID=379064 RepID=UPI001680D742|nr:hypothetical protein [Cyanobacterium aponinum]MBD2393022.1 hypothetical protein [Cyanobacterium aponinum FACHB-4101]WRL39572.1 hypothetical protein VKI22_05660 [Cyanobacterium aponinum UTEX 3221]
MERGLLWLPLLVLFFWLAWSGKKEYDKVQAYQAWAEQFDKSKYDIYSVLGKKGDLITIGIPTNQGIKEQKTFSLQNLSQLNLLIKNQVVDVDNLPEKGEATLQFSLKENQTIDVPFTDINIASQWFKYLKKLII